MALVGIDISSHQAGLNLYSISHDFVAIKATEGTSYVNPYCDNWFQQAKAKGKKLAVYHFIDFDANIIDQANFFVQNCLGYIHEAIFVLDWEGQHVDRVWDALIFLQHVEYRIGYKPAIYMSEYVENLYNWSDVAAQNYGLWLAKYANYEIDNNYDMSKAGQAPAVKHWPFYFMWQWTSKGHLNGYAGDLDCNIAYLTGDAWDKYAGKAAATTTTTAPVQPTTTTTTTVAVPVNPPDPTTTTTTTVPVTTGTTTERGPEGPTATTTTTTPAAPELSLWTAIWAVLVAIINRLQGAQK